MCQYWCQQQHWRSWKRISFVVSSLFVASFIDCRFVSFFWRSASTTCSNQRSSSSSWLRERRQCGRNSHAAAEKEGPQDFDEDEVIVAGESGQNIPQAKIVAAVIFCDSNYFTDKGTRKSISGLVSTLGGTLLTCSAISRGPGTLSNARGRISCNVVMKHTRE